MSDSLGRTYQPGENIVTEGEVGDCMYVIQHGKAEVIRTEDGVSTVVDTMGVRGGSIHSSDESLIVSSLAERAALSTRVIERLAQGALN